MTNPTSESAKQAYDKIDRFLRNNLDDTDYADFSAALDLVYADAERLDWFLLDCDFDGINGFDVREMAYEAVPHSATESEYNAAYLAACRKAIDAAIAAIQRT